MPFIRFFVSIILSFFFVQLLWADSSPTQSLINNLLNYQQLQGEFTQNVYDQNGSILLKSSGDFALARSLKAPQENGKFRWHTRVPSEQLLIANGQKIYFYDRALQQVTIKKQTGAMNQQSPAMLLSGDLQKISKLYQVTLQKKGRKKIYILTPNKETFFNQLTLNFLQTKGKDSLSGMAIKDGLGQTTEIIFTNLKLQSSANLFQFIPPPGVDIIQASV